MRLKPRLLFLVFIALLSRAPAQSVFGSATLGEAALTGILYDLKQTQQRVPTSMDPQSYRALVTEFLTHQWDEAILNRYYRVTQPLYTTQLFIPNMGADAAPKAFGVEQIVKPRLWLAHYKAQVAAPSAGAWRFWGFSDDFCAVAVNGRTVLFAGRFIGPWKPTDKTRGLPAANGNLTPGDWVELKAGEVVDLDIAIGETPGGTFCGFIMIEKRGDTYAQSAGSPVLPIFQLAPFDTPVPASPKDAPLFVKNGPIWKALQ
jgi:hypothetical protein